jgi:hypothetical protein
MSFIHIGLVYTSSTHISIGGDVCYGQIKFLQDQLRDTLSLSNIYSSDDEDDLPAFNEVISVYNSAVATFYAPSDFSGIGSMHRESIHALSS